MPELLGYQFDRTFAQPIERYRQVATTAERDAIPSGKRWEGMLCYVTSDELDYQLVGGISNGDWTTSGAGNYFDISADDSDDITEGVVNLFLSTTDQAKLNFITITQAVDLDALEIAVNALGSGVTFKGTWSPSGGVFPGGFYTAVGDLWIADDGGTIDGVTFALGDGLIATIISASTTVFAGNWAKTDSQSDVTSVVGLTGAISKAALLSALNVEDGATNDQTGAEIVAAITTELGSSAWETQLTTEQVQDLVGGMVTGNTESNITVTYQDGDGTLDFVVPDFIQVYATLATIISDEANLVDHYLYEISDASGFTSITSGTAWVRWLGTTLATEADFVVVSAAENAVVPAPIPLAPYANLAALIAGQANQTNKYIYEVTDASGFTEVSSGYAFVKYLGTVLATEADYTIISTENIDGGTP